MAMPDSSTTSNDGALRSLYAKGRQDAVLATDGRGEAYQVVYRRLPELNLRPGSSGLRRCITLARDYDCVSRVDLALRLGANPINAAIASIETWVGGQRFDAFQVRDDIETQIRATCALLGREGPSVEGDWTFLPLALAPFLNHAPVASTRYHEIQVAVNLKVPMADADIELYGDVYFVGPDTRRKLADEPHEFTTVQSQYTGSELVEAGADVGYEGDFKRAAAPGVNLHFNHPVQAVFFWGHNPAKVTRVRLMLDGATFYDGRLEGLERAKRARCPRMPQGVAVIFFTDAPIGSASSRSSVNFSRVDHAKLVLTTDEDATVHAVGLNMQPVAFVSGMAGLRFSK
jgi:hypothetical protein